MSGYDDWADLVMGCFEVYCDDNGLDPLLFAARLALVLIAPTCLFLYLLFVALGTDRDEACSGLLNAQSLRHFG